MTEQVEPPEVETSAESTGRSNERTRNWLISLLVVLTSVGVVLSAVAIWMHETVFNTDAFMEAVGPALVDPALHAAIADEVSGQIVVVLDVETRVTKGLGELDQYLSSTLLEALDVGQRGRDLLSNFNRPALTDLAPAIASGIENRIDRVVDAFFNSDVFEEVFPRVVKRAHELFVLAVRGDVGDLPNVTANGDQVTLNLLPVITGVLQDVANELKGLGPDITIPASISDDIDQARSQLSSALQADLPEDFGEVTITVPESLMTVRDAARSFDQLVWVIPVATLILLALTVVLASDRRLTLIQLGIGLIIGIVMGWLILREIQEAILQQVTNPDGFDATQTLLSDLVSDLRIAAWIVVILAVVGVIGAYLLGRPAWLDPEGAAEADAAPERFVERRYNLLRLLGVAAALLALVLTGLGIAQFVVVLVLLIAYLWILEIARKRGSSPEPGEAISTSAL